MSSFNSTVTPQHTSAGQPDNHDSDCLPVIGLFPRTNLPNPEIPDIAAMSDGERRLWLASRREPVVDQLPQARRTPDGYPPGDLQPGTQRKWAACVGAARPALESVAPAGGAISPPCSEEGLIVTILHKSRCATFRRRNHISHMVLGLVLATNYTCCGLYTL